MAPLQLHVWGPAFGLPSVEAECIAIIAYFATGLVAEEFELVQSSPSNVPTYHLPALYDSQTGLWTAGFDAIVKNLPTSGPAPIDPKFTVYQSYLSVHAGPLISLSLFVSSANYASTTRPAVTKILPFPLAWTEGPVLRAKMSERAAHLGLESLDAERVATRREEEAADRKARGWISAPKTMRTKEGRVWEALERNPEHASRIRLDRLAGDVFGVLGGVDLFVLGHGTDGEKSEATKEAGESDIRLACLAYGYLALMLYPDVPRPWLREALCAPRHARLRNAVESFHNTYFAGPDRVALPWRQDAPSKWRVAVWFTQGIGATLLPEWLGSASVSRASGAQDKIMINSQLARRGGGIVLSACAAAVIAQVGLLVFGMYPLGLPVQRFQAPRIGLRGLGVATAMFSRAASTDPPDLQVD